MKKYIPLFLLTVIIAACNRSKHKALKQDKIVHQTKFKDSIVAGKPKRMGSFIDSTNVGRKNFNKVELMRYAIADSGYVVIRFFSRQNTKWVLKNEFHFPANDVNNCEPQLADFNNDRMNDFTYISDLAGRGANEIRTLFIYDKNMDRLIRIKNSDRNPNLSYNDELHCINSWGFSGSTYAAFLKLQADSLHEFASVEQGDDIIASIYNQKGKQRVILKKKNTYNGFMEFKNYRPLKVY